MTIGRMISRISNEIDRTDMTAEISDAIASAISHYAGQRFWFNEQRWTATTVASQEYYQLPVKFREIDTLNVQVNSQNNYRLYERTFKELDDMALAAETYTGYPTDFALQRNELRLYPVPNGAYTLTLTGLADLSDLSASDSTNAWMTTGEELIRSRAARDVLENVRQDYDNPRIQLFERREQDALAMLQKTSTMRLTTGRTRKARFA